MSPDGSITPGGTGNGAEAPWSGAATIWPLAPGPDGEMWAAAGNGFIQLDATGSGTVISAPKSGNTTFQFIQVLANGTDGMESLSECTVARSGLIQSTNLCFTAVSPGGSETILAKPPGDLGNSYANHTNLGVMDRSGTVWDIIDGTDNGKAPQGQYLIEVGPGGATQTFPFTVPGDGINLIPYAAYAPVITSNAGVWTADTASRYPGALIEIIPKA